MKTSNIKNKLIFSIVFMYFYLRYTLNIQNIWKKIRNREKYHKLKINMLIISRKQHCVYLNNMLLYFFFFVVCKNGQIC